ncbi:MAG: transketolase [Gammaproteobacteria bacterium]|nr:MAG: transketolase [Gammaproteobacteria bacterium]
MPSPTERANAIRALAMDAVQRAKSGHPGAPMGLADIAEVLWREMLRHNPNNPNWPNRDRFVLSNGHASLLLYSVLHLSGYPVSIEDLKNFRQLGAPTAGHPEYGECPGVETTTGPLGQGLANAVGMALAERQLAATFNRDGHPIIDHRTWVVVGDGCLMEGVSHEVASLAGTLKLGKLICVYDDNGISIDGETKDWFTEDVPARFEAYGWRVIRDVDGHDPEEVRRALQDACADESRPTLVCARTIIGFGAPTKQGTAGAHGSPLGETEIADARRVLNWGYEPFEIPPEIYAEWDCRESGAAREAQWQVALDAYRKAYPELAAELERRLSGELPMGWAEDLEQYALAAQAQNDDLATRNSSQRCLSLIAARMPELFGGSADLTGSNGTRFDGAINAANDDAGNYLSYGVREFGMSAICNGIALHGGLIPYSGTFLVFMEYARNALRLAALMGIRNVFVYTHDSVGLGEDGPTHQPVEQLANLRATPNLSTWRPCDTVETAFAWRAALARKDGPSALILTRQKIRAQSRDPATFAEVARGGYVLVREQGDLDAIVIATGSEVELAVDASDQLRAEGIDVRVVSMPSVDTFLAQSEDYRQSVLPDSVRARVAVEAGHPDAWHRFVGLDGAVVGIARFGTSAPGAEAMSAMGMDSNAVVEAVRRVTAA